MKINKGLIGGSNNLLILSLLNDKDMYGYEIIKELEIRSDKVFQFKEGTLYPVLHKLENNGYIESYKGDGEAGRKRKYYTITKKGIRDLAEEKKQWQVFSTSINKLIGGDEHAFS